jgi:hypothetical protein
MWLAQDDLLAVVIVVNAVALLAGKYSIYKDHFKSSVVMTMVMLIEQVVFIGIAFLIPEETTSTALLSSVFGSYVSAALWDSRSFNIESLSWKRKLSNQAFYVIVTVSCVLLFSGSLGKVRVLPVWTLLSQLIAGIFFSEIVYSVCKRNQLLSPAWRGVRLESRYASHLSSTITTPTSDRVIRI